MKVIGIIPARGGSKRIPNKNIRKFNGKPLLVWTIEEAKKSKLIDLVICSTEDKNIMVISTENGCSVLMRPEIFATDEASTTDVVLHAITAFPNYDAAVILQPTSPLRTVEDIDCGISLGMSISVGPKGAPNGAVYVVKTEVFKRYPYFGGQVFYMPRERSIDIDTEEDWKLAEEYSHSVHDVSISSLIGG